MLIPYGIQTYRRADLPRIRLANLYAEKTPTTPNQVALLPRPGLSPYQEVGSGPIRGLFHAPGALSGTLFALSGTALYGGTTSLGSVPGTSRVRMAATLDTLLIPTGDAFYRSDGATVTAISFPDGAGVIWAGFLGGYAFAFRTNSRRIYFTLDPTTWDGLDYLSAEQGTSNLVGGAIVADQLWAFCEDRTEIFTLTGDPDAPLQRLEGRLFDKGALSRDAIVTMDNTVIWVGHDGVAYRGESTPLRISDHGIEEMIANSDTADISAWAYPWNGHLFYVLHTSEGTVVFDPATQQWHEQASYGRTRWRAGTGVLFGRNVIAGDDETGQLWQLDGSTLSDDGDAIERWFTVILNKSGFADNVTVECETGQTSGVSDDPGILELRTSRDGGMNFSSWRQASLGQWGATRTRAMFRRLGIVDQGGLICQFRMTDPKSYRISYVLLNEALGGRGR